MSGSDLAVAAIAVACFYSLWWCLSLARRVRRIERTSKIDPLTGLGSGDWLHAERWPAALRSGRPLGVVYLDLDNLKLTNDSRGHAAGDEYIRTAADTLGKAVRRGVDEVFRTHRAGDEFEVLLHGSIGDLNRCAWSLLQRLAERGVNASLGLAYTTATEFVPARADLRLAAEAACREAKKRGGSCGILAGHGLVTSPDCDMTSSSGTSPSIASTAAGAPLRATDGGIPLASPRPEQVRSDGERIRNKREAVGWTRRELAAVCQTTNATIQDLESGRRFVDPTTLAQIEACLDAELAKLGLASKKR